MLGFGIILGNFGPKAAGTSPHTWFRHHLQSFWAMGKRPRAYAADPSKQEAKRCCSAKPSFKPSCPKVPICFVNGLHDRINLVLGAISAAGVTRAKCMVVA